MRLFAGKEKAGECSILFGWVLTNPPDLGYNDPYIVKSCEEKSMFSEPFREPRQV